jgi:Fe-S-cluster containining protein
MKEIEKLKEEILKDYPRLDKDSSFTFSCHPGVPCFNACCSDVNIFLTPYDILRLKNALGITSQEFLSKYTVSPFDQNLKYPVILLQMRDDEKTSCPFVTEKGCSVYEDRPWACRMYPLGLASPGENCPDLNEEFYFLLKEAVCKGFGEDKKHTVSQWLSEQGIEDYNEMGQDFKDLTLHKLFQEGQDLTPKKVEIFFLACYNIDKFRSFVFDSTFLEKFVVDEVTIEKIRKDDVELLKFGYKWLRFALFGENTLTINDSVVQEKKEAIEKKKAELEKEKSQSEKR